MVFKTTISALAALIWLSLPGMSQTTQPAPDQPAHDGANNNRTSDPAHYDRANDTVVQSTQDEDTDFG
jgi:hypothetical protein